MSVSVVVKHGAYTTGEGPYWDPSSKSLLYVDIIAGDVHKWDSKTQDDTKVHFNNSVNFIVPRKTGGCVIGLGQTVSNFDWESSEHSILAEVDQGKNTRFNDAKCDASGRLWCEIIDVGTGFQNQGRLLAFIPAIIIVHQGTMGQEKVPAQPERKQGSLYSLGKGNQIKKHLDNIDISNGLAWTEDNKTMYYIDSFPRKLYAFDFDIQEGKISNQRVAVDFEKEPKDVWGYPDGMCIDTQGKLWVACYSVGKVICFDPQTGTDLQTIKFPASRITSCCFGGENMDELYVTSGKFGASEEEIQREPLAGSVFKATGLGVKGKAAPVFED